MSAPAPSRSRPSAGPSIGGMSAPASTGMLGRSNTLTRDSIMDQRSMAGPSGTSAVPTSRRPAQDDPVRAAQDEATRVWRADMRRLLERAEERFADICWTTATASSHDQSDLDSDSGHASYNGFAASFDSSMGNTTNGAATSLISTRRTTGSSSIPQSSDSSGTLIWAHKAILYARASNTFQTRFLNLRLPAAQLQHIGSTASLVFLPLHRSESHASLSSTLSNATQTGTSSVNHSSVTTHASSVSSRPGIAPKPRKSIRGAAPPSSFSMTKRKPISRSSISRPLRRPSVDDASSYASGFMTSDSEGEGGGSTVSLRASRLINARTIPDKQPAMLASPTKASHTPPASYESNTPGRKQSFASVTSEAESRFTEARSSISDASTILAPLSLGGVSQAFFEATLQYLYTGEEAMVDAFEFLFEDRLAPDSDATPEERIDKLRSDLTFMWRSKLYSDVKIVLGDEEGPDDAAGAGVGEHRKRGVSKMVDIPDANMSVLSLAQTIDTEMMDESEDEDELTSFSAHRMILASRSQYFASMLLSPYADSKAPVLRLPSPPFTPASLHFTLGFLYTGTLFFSNRTFDLSTAFSLWRAGAYLQIETFQALVTALIDREFCHGFTCSPPCRKCVKRVPRTLTFASSPDVSEPALQTPAIAAVSGTHFGMYWAKDIGNLDPLLQDRIVDAITARLQDDPTLVVSVLRQLSIVGQKIDTERSSRWVETLRLMAETVENRIMPLLHSHLETIVQSKAWTDLVDGVGSLGDVLEKALVMLIDGLTEAKAAQIYQLLVGQVLLREQGFEVAASRQAVENARTSILRYLKKRWINVRALSGFNRLENWCLKEIADELDVAATDLILPEEPPKTMPTVPTLGRAATATRRSSSIATPPGVPSRLRTPSGASSTGLDSRSSTASRRVAKEDGGEREAGPINMRAAVLNRNAARTAVVNAGRTVSSASTASSVSSTAVRAPATTTATATAQRSASATAKPSPPTATRPAAGANGTTPRSTTSSRLRTESNASVASARSTSTSSNKPSSSAARSASRPPPAAVKTSSADTPKQLTPKRSTTHLATHTTPTAGAVDADDADKTPTKPTRAVRPAATAPAPSRKLSNPQEPNPDPPAAAAPVALGKKSSFLRATPRPGGTFSLSTSDSGRGLRARSASSVSSSSSSKKNAEASADKSVSRAVTRTGTGKISTSADAEPMPQDALAQVRKASSSSSDSGMIKSDSNRTIIHHALAVSEVQKETTDNADSTSAPAAPAQGMTLMVGIPCIISLTLPSSAGRSTQANMVGGVANKLRANVRYIGGVKGFKGVWVGVEVHLPLTSTLSDAISGSTAKPPLRLQNGALNGVQYISASSQRTSATTENQDRLKRRIQLWKTLSPNAEFVHTHMQTSEADKELPTEMDNVQLLIRPSDVVWVIQ